MYDSNRYLKQAFNFFCSVTNNLSSTSLATTLPKTISLTISCMDLDTAFEEFEPPAPTETFDAYNKAKYEK